MNESDRIVRLRHLAGEIRNYQLERDWSDAKLIKEIAHLGSTKTFKRILDDSDDLVELNLDNQLAAFENAVELVNARRSKDLPPEPEYADFQNIINVRQAVADALQEESISRFVCVEGENGTGKDASIHALRSIWPKASAELEANDLWRDSLAVPLADIINCLSIRRQNEESGEPFRMPQRLAQRLEIVLDELGKRKIILLINEAHSMGPPGLNLIRTIISRTPCIPVLFCIPALLKRLLEVGYEEAAQLFGNRLSRRVHLESPGVDEILLLMKRRGITFPDKDSAARCAQAVEKDAPCYGNWRFVINVTRRVHRLADGKPIMLSKFVEAITYVRGQSWAQQLSKR